MSKNLALYGGLNTAPTSCATAALVALALLGTSQPAQALVEPPEFDPGPPPDYVPPPLGDTAIAPFSASDPGSKELTYGRNLELRVISNFAADSTFQWSKDGETLAGETAPSLSIQAVAKSDAGLYTVEISAGGRVISTIETLFSVFSQATLANLSTRAAAQAGEDTLISGFVISGIGSKTLLLRAVGPTIGEAPFNVSGTMGNPSMTIFRGSTKLMEYLDWQSFADQGALASATSSTGAFVLNSGSTDSAAVMTLSAGEYTVHVKGTSEQTGVVLVELFDATEGESEAKLVNISSRAYVGTGDSVLIPGAVVEGLTPKRVLIRAVGPSLESLGVTGFLTDPKLTVLSDGVEIGANDDWPDFPDQTELTDATQGAGAFPLDAGSADAAGVFLLEPGAYTVVVEGVGGATGIALVEIYSIDD